MYCNLASFPFLPHEMPAAPSRNVYMDLISESFEQKMFLCSIYRLVSSFMRARRPDDWVGENCFRNISPQCVVRRCIGHRGMLSQVLCEDTWSRLEGSSAPGSDQESGNHHRSTSPSQFSWNLSLNRNSKCWKLAYLTHLLQFLECACEGGGGTFSSTF